MKEVRKLDRKLKSFVFRLNEKDHKCFMEVKDRLNMPSLASMIRKVVLDLHREIDK